VVEGGGGGGWGGGGGGGAGGLQLGTPKFDFPDWIIYVHKVTPRFIFYIIVILLSVFQVFSFLPISLRTSAVRATFLAPLTSPLWSS